MGEGLPPIPKRIIDRITGWKYVDMASRQPKQVTDFHTWLQYLALYCSQNAAVTENCKCSANKPSIYSFCFTRKAAISTRCDLCLSTGHVTRNCPLQEDADQDLPIRLKAVETAVLSLAGQSKGGNAGTKIKSGQVCCLFNNDACRYKNCKHLHQCSNCREQHKAIACPK